MARRKSVAADVRAAVRAIAIDRCNEIRRNSGVYTREETREYDYTTGEHETKVTYVFKDKSLSSNEFKKKLQAKTEKTEAYKDLIAKIVSDVKKSGFIKANVKVDGVRLTPYTVGGLVREPDLWVDESSNALVSDLNNSILLIAKGMMSKEYRDAVKAEERCEKIMGLVNSRVLEIILDKDVRAALDSFRKEIGNM